MTWQVLYSPAAVEDLERWFDHILARELNSPTGDLDTPTRALEAIERACQLLTHSPFSCRKVGESPFLRELIMSFASTGTWLCSKSATPDRSSSAPSGISSKATTTDRVGAGRVMARM